MSLKPDLVVLAGSKGMPPSQLADIERLGIPADLDAAEAFYAGVAELPTVFIAIEQDLWTVGPSSFLSDVATIAGGRNAMEGETLQYLQVSTEALIDKDPDAIVVTVPEEQAQGLLANPAWGSLRAVKDGRAHFVDADLVARAGPSVALADVAAS